MRRAAIALLMLCALAGCGALPSRDRVQEDLQAIAQAGAPEEAITVSLVALRRTDGDFEALNHEVDYDLLIWRSGPIHGPLVGGAIDARAGQHLRGGKATLVYVRGEGRPWQVAGLRLDRPPSPAAASAPGG